jgi:hypothetical protein
VEDVDQDQSIQAESWKGHDWRWKALDSIVSLLDTNHNFPATSAASTDQVPPPTPTRPSRNICGPQQ